MFDLVDRAGDLAQSLRQCGTTTQDRPDRAAPHPHRDGGLDGGSPGGEHDVATVVIAEDDRDIRELVALILDEDGYTTVPASDGLEALEACRTARPDVVLLDVSMPGELNGLEVCRRIRADEGCARPDHAAHRAGPGPGRRARGTPPAPTTTS